MDDSERSYGYSQDIYHGQRGAGGHYDRTGEDGGSSSPERSYEYGPEGEDGFPDPDEVEVSPEEAAIHIEEQGFSPSGGDERGGQYDHDRGGNAEEVESFTWENSDSEDRKDGKAR